MTRSPSRRAASAIVVPLVTVVLAGCGADPGPSEGRASDPDAAATATGGAATSATAAPAAPSSGVPSSAPAAAAPAALRFTARTVGGREFDGASLAGRPVVLWFWAPWCSVCARQAPEVADLARRYGDRVAFVGVGSLDKGPALKRFAGRAPGPIHLDDEDGTLYRDFGVSEQSSFVVLDARGEEVLRSGYDDDEALDEVVARLAG
ncbi:TlpA family protein disulfide reductase [Nocardioides sp.]|uniref:TlpA family protein disulfide reductase n=1 Tax=Nocardioides sp. TaxID=35761 RepID=UPI003510DDE8